MPGGQPLRAFPCLDPTPLAHGRAGLPRAYPVRMSRGLRCANPRILCACPVRVHSNFPLIFAALAHTCCAPGHVYSGVSVCICMSVESPLTHHTHHPPTTNTYFLSPFFFFFSFLQEMRNMYGGSGGLDRGVCGMVEWTRHSDADTHTLPIPA
jgi:hypothetical protein